MGKLKSYIADLEYEIYKDMSRIGSHSKSFNAFEKAYREAYQQEGLHSQYDSEIAAVVWFDELGKAV